MPEEEKRKDVKKEEVKTLLQRAIEKREKREAEKALNYFDFTHLKINRIWSQFPLPINIATVPSKEISGEFEDWIRSKYGGGRYSVTFVKQGTGGKTEDLVTKEIAIGGPMPMLTATEELLLKGPAREDTKAFEVKLGELYKPNSAEDTKTFLQMQDLAREKRDLETRLTAMQEEKIKGEMEAIKKQIEEAKTINIATGQPSIPIELIKEIEMLKAELKLSQQSSRTDWGAMIIGVATQIPLLMKAINDMKTLPAPSALEAILPQILPILINKATEKPPMPESRPIENPQNPLQTLEALSGSIEKLFSIGYDIASKTSGGGDYDWKKDLFGAIKEVAKFVLDKQGQGQMNPAQIAQLMQMYPQLREELSVGGNGQHTASVAPVPAPEQPKFSMGDMLRKIQFAIQRKVAPQKVASMVLEIAEWAQQNGYMQDDRIVNLFQHPETSMDMLLASIPELANSDNTEYRKEIKECVVAELIRMPE